MKKDFEEKELSECSFKPKIIDYKSKGHAEDKDHYIRLYKLARKRGNDKSTNDYEFEKARGQCTFTPNIVKEEVDTTPVTVDKAMVERTIERMKKGREERERINNAVFNKKYSVDIEHKPKENMIRETSSPRRSEEKKQLSGFQPKQIPIDNKEAVIAETESVGPFSDVQVVEESYIKAQSEENTGESPTKTEEPLLFIDVDLGNAKKRIVIFKGDKPSLLAEAIAKENSKSNCNELDLDDITKEKLEELITTEVQKVLDKIEEEDENN